MRHSTLQLLNDYSLLIVEDDEVARMMLRQGLKPHCKSFYEAKDGLQGLEIFKEFKIDIIITDIHMPNLNGFDMIKQIHLLNPKIPFIVMTSYDTDKNILSSIEDGALSFLRKPLDILDLQTSILIGLSKNKSNQLIQISPSIRIDTHKEIIYKNDEPIFLTHKNHKIFWLLYYNLNKIVTYDMFEDYVYENESIKNSTLHTAILRIKKDLLDINIENIANMGYILKD